MPNQSKRQSSYVKLALATILAIVSSGCALGVTRVNVAHDPLAVAENKKEGNVLVKQFIDKRKDTRYIGNKRNMYGMVLGHIGMLEGIKLESLLTEYFAEALRQAGYNAIVLDSRSADKKSEIKFDAVMEGEIKAFWLDLYMATWHNVLVMVKAVDKVTLKVKWEKEIQGSERNVLWVGATAEYERVIRQALTKALNNAAKEFASDEFHKSIK